MSRYSVRDIIGLKEFYSESLIKIVSNELRLTRLDAAKRISELTKYLAVVAAAQAQDPGVHYSPPKNLDQVWHLWLLPEHRSSYNQFCDMFLGRRVDHFPMPAQPRDNFETVASELGLKLDKTCWNSDEPDADCG